MTSQRRVEIVDQGRSGTVTYSEGEARISLWWEFGLEPTLAFVDGPKRAGFDRDFPWAAGRQAEIYDHIAREVVRQRAPGHGYDVDLESGSIRILRRAVAEQRESPLDLPPLDPPPLDLQAIAMREPGALLGEFMQRVFQGATGGIPERSPENVERTDDELRDGMRDHVSVAKRLEAAEQLHARGLLDDVELAPFVRRQLRAISRRDDGLALALALAERYDSPAMRQALLYASYNGTPCAPASAELLLRLASRDAEPGSPEASDLLARIDPHNSSFTRQAAFAELCERVGMTFEPDAD